MATPSEPKADPLRGRSLAELREMLRRQERLMAERKFISRLPDKGKKISDFAEKLRAVIAQEEELRRTAELLSAVRLEFQKKQEATEFGKQNIVVSNNGSAFEDAGFRNEVKSDLQNNESTWTQEKSTKNKTKLLEQTMEVSHIPQGNEKLWEVTETRRQGDAQKGPEDSPLDQPENAALSANRTSQVLSDAFERFSIAGKESDRKPEKGQKVESNSNPFQNLSNMPRKTPHYIEVLEQRTMNPVTKKSKFKTNVLPAESSGSSHGSPDIPSPGGFSSSISAEERRHRDKKHLDDITAARLPPLHHQPSQLISIGESIAIQIQQKEAYEEMQAKLAAQRLAKKLGIKMVSYEPEGETATSYREVKDEEGYSSAED
ncbi:hypothetical protein JD844_014032 [Phrynosoma platyrhinos]|uniref:DNA-directed RNA polymerase II subunit GRINL1A n=1 Tax=Phrynosoma platyrhinos TaxID=52577 RepID=A0ABQ7SR50_PHRPL|nr:hypothetical protein JD844_014032 [Phrynosoma platyrhinos]